MDKIGNWITTSLLVCSSIVIINGDKEGAIYLALIAILSILSNIHDTLTKPKNK